MDDRERKRRYTRCSFCGKGQDQVRKLVAGPGVYICNDCVELCHEVLAEDAAPGRPKCSTEWRATAGPRRASFWERLRRWFSPVSHRELHIS